MCIYLYSVCVLKLGVVQLSGEPIDFSVLTNIFGDDKELCDSILEEFSNSAEPYMLELKQAFEEGCSDGVKSLAHKLKSSSRTVGAEELGDLCQILESSAPGRDWTLIDSQQLAVQKALAQVVNFIHESK